MMGVTQIYGDQSLADAIAQSGETVGMPWTSERQKRYVGGILPVGDIIVAYADVARPWFSEHEHHPDTEYLVAAHWQWQIHAWSMLVFLPAAIIFWRRQLGRKTVDGTLVDDGSSRRAEGETINRNEN